MGALYHSFGRTAAPAHRAIGADEAIAQLKVGRRQERSLLAYGNGRSYGDSCLNGSGTLVDMRAKSRILSFDAQTGFLKAEAGAMLADIIDLAAPQGWFPAVVPGTRFITLGGAIANDVHGKNHHRRGTFGRHVEALTLLRSDGTLHYCRADQESELFRATVGGMGLTGLILDATIRLMKVGSADVEEEATAFSSLEEYFALAEEADSRNEYAVAWIDQLATGAAAGRGLLLTANHAREGTFRPAPKAWLSVPLQPPFNVLNNASIRLFNKAYRWVKQRKSGLERSGFAGYFFPLDGVRHWNRLYGPGGLFQHQSVVPEEAARKAIPAMLSAARAAGQASFLTVLKRFGDVPSPGLLSFPRLGYTLTLDFPNRGKRTLQLLEKLDEITVAAGGAVNPYKDARMAAEVFAASFPDWQALERTRDPAFMSDFWQRTAMRAASSVRLDQAAE
ncbi:FAD-binding oxidoreductase [Chelativorans sp. M5D2P16]|uniref:FAD-binding oxidoreductase n=1 Tax=Chelativorans sp. M5D2P16 TaxID=3095678 RepID=UPI002ACA0D8E|nr:FAD-binding oxidoreductase [Chelativorans sp. M5D2P16]MDZ5696332.1 FAD-binding oxidoreductase [Chelativorans sp. M5D2P16]